MKELEGGADPGLFLFESATHVMWAEEVAREERVPVEVVPAPEGMDDICGLAIRTLPNQDGAFEGILREEGIPFKRLP
jgi:hypothetical protein